MIKRAAQFAPFAALNGYDDAVEESARLTDDKVELEDNAVDELNRKINEAVSLGSRVVVTYFVPDEKKEGGKYAKVTGRIRKADMGMIVMDDGFKIIVENVREVEPVNDGE